MSSKCFIDARGKFTAIVHSEHSMLEGNFSLILSQLLRCSFFKAASGSGKSSSEPLASKHPRYLRTRYPAWAMEQSAGNPQLKSCLPPHSDPRELLGHCPRFPLCRARMKGLLACAATPGVWLAHLQLR